MREERGKEVCFSYRDFYKKATCSVFNVDSGFNLSHACSAPPMGTPPPPIPPAATLFCALAVAATKFIANSTLALLVLRSLFYGLIPQVPDTESVFCKIMCNGDVVTGCVVRLRCVVSCVVRLRGEHGDRFRLSKPIMWFRVFSSHSRISSTTRP